MFISAEHPVDNSPQGGELSTKSTGLSTKVQVERVVRDAET
jgi:hypothetical protein